MKKVIMFLFVLVGMNLTAQAQAQAAKIGTIEEIEAFYLEYEYIDIYEFTSEGLMPEKPISEVKAYTKVIFNYAGKKSIKIINNKADLTLYNYRIEKEYDGLTEIKAFTEEGEDVLVYYSADSKIFMLDTLDGKAIVFIP